MPNESLTIHVIIITVILAVIIPLCFHLFLRHTTKRSSLGDKHHPGPAKGWSYDGKFTWFGNERKKYLGETFPPNGASKPEK